MSNSNKIGIVILAAGIGKRMRSDLPKVMHLLGGKPLIDWVVSSAEKIHEEKRIVIVVSSKHTLVQEYIGNRAEYVIQDEPKGTGHAVSCTIPLLRGQVEKIMVLNSDIPLVSSESLETLLQKDTETQSAVSILTTTVSDFEDWRSVLLSFGRIIRSPSGEVEEIREYKDCSEEQKSIKELNTGQYCFDAQWLFEHLPLLNTQNVQGEFYLTDMIKLALESGKKVITVAINPEQTIGVSTPEDLQLAQQFVV